jgi:hypothetical protein
MRVVVMLLRGVALKSGQGSQDLHRTLVSVGS